jgi:hypothetical protein
VFDKAQLLGLACETVPLHGGMRVRVEDYRREAGSIVIANPNAPTGVADPREHETYLCHREAPQGAVAIPARRLCGQDCFAALAMTPSSQRLAANAHSLDWVVLVMDRVR